MSVCLCVDLGVRSRPPACVYVFPPRPNLLSPLLSRSHVERLYLFLSQSLSLFLVFFWILPLSSDPCLVCAACVCACQFRDSFAPMHSRVLCLAFFRFLPLLIFLSPHYVCTLLCESMCPCNRCSWSTTMNPKTIKGPDREEYNKQSIGTAILLDDNGCKNSYQ